jgi:hypothetical protein
MTIHYLLHFKSNYVISQIIFKNCSLKSYFVEYKSFMELSTLNLFAINRHPTDYDLRNCRTHSCHPMFIREAVFRFGLSCEYPQSLSVKTGFAHAKGTAVLAGRRVYFFLLWSGDFSSWSLWTWPDKEGDIQWFIKVFDTLRDVSTGNFFVKQQ